MSHDLGVTANATVQSIQGRRREELRRRFEASLRAVVNTAEGRVVLRWLLEEAGLLAASFAPGQGLGPTDIAWREGRRSFGLALMQNLTALDPRFFAVLMAEAAEERAEDKTYLEAALLEVAKD